MSAPAALLALADQRLPSGGHVHSGGVEQAITDGLIHDVTSLERFLERRLATTGLVTAGVVAAAARLAAHPRAPMMIELLDAETDARTPSPAQRTASRAQGRGLLRTARACWAAPSPQLAWTSLGPRPHHAIVLGCSACAAGVDDAGAALAAAYLAVSAPSTAAQRLLALDPVTVAAITVRLSAAIEDVARRATRPESRPAPMPDHHDHVGPASGEAAIRYGPASGEAAIRYGPGDLAFLPDDSDPLLDLLAERHAAREERLFAS